MVAGPGSARARALVRHGAATALGVYGRAVLTVAQLLEPGVNAGVRALPGRSSGGPTDEPLPDVQNRTANRLDARTAELAEVRRAALDATLSAAADPSRPAAARFAERVDGLSDWAAGRLLDETERMRQAAVAVVAAGSSDGHVLPRRAFDPALRRQIPWSDDITAGRLYDHAVVVARRIRQPEPAPADVEVPAGLIGSLIGRLRSR